MGAFGQGTVPAKLQAAHARNLTQGLLFSGEGELPRSPFLLLPQFASHGSHMSMGI